MKLTEIFNMLSYGELSNLKIAGEDGVVPKEKYAKIITSVNLGLTALHNRFLLQVGTLYVDLIEGQQQYILKRLYQVGNPEGLRFVQYIRESDPTFADDIIRIEQVFDQNGRELGLNDPVNLYAVSTPNMSTLRVPLGLVKEEKVTSLTVLYRADHKRIVWEDKTFDPDDEEVELPYSHLQALVYYVASRIHNPTGFTDTNHEGNNYAAKYERECGNLEAQNLRVDTSETNTKTMRGGWV